MTTAEAVAKIRQADPAFLLTTATERAAELEELTEVATDADKRGRQLQAGGWEGAAQVCFVIRDRATDRIDEIARGPLGCDR